MTNRACSLIFPTAILTNFQPENKKYTVMRNSNKASRNLNHIHANINKGKGEPQSVN